MSRFLALCNDWCPYNSLTQLPFLAQGVFYANKEVFEIEDVAGFIQHLAVDAKNRWVEVISASDQIRSLIVI